MVIGAEGRHSTVAQVVGPEQYHQRPRLQVAYYSYWSGLPMDGRVETYVRDHRAFTAIPTHDGLTLVVGCRPHAEHNANRNDVEGAFAEMFDLAPPFAKRIAAAARESRFVGTAVPNFFRKPFGPGWALVGDAGYTKDPITAQGITDAFHDAQLCADAVDEALSGARSYEVAMGAYQAARDHRALPMYEFSCELARLDPISAELEQLLAAMQGNQEAMDGFARFYGGAVPRAEFFSDGNVAHILAGAAQKARCPSPNQRR